MISGAAFCPHPPLLVPGVAGRASGELDAVRSACSAAIRGAAVPGSAVVLLGGGPRTTQYPECSGGTLRGYGVDVTVPPGADPEPGAGLPPSLTIGAWLIAEALGPDTRAVAWSVASADAGVELPAGPTTLVVMGDGSARRSPSAPGYLDDRAAPFDATVATALASGDPDALRVDVLLGDELLAAGPRAWNVAARLLAGRAWSAELLCDSAPYGVGYFVAMWRSA